MKEFWRDAELQAIMPFAALVALGLLMGRPSRSAARTTWSSRVSQYLAFIAVLAWGYALFAPVEVEELGDFPLSIAWSLLAIAGSLVSVAARDAGTGMAGHGLLLAAVVMLLLDSDHWGLAGATAMVGGFSLRAAASWLRAHPEPNRGIRASSAEWGETFLVALLTLGLLASFPLLLGRQAVRLSVPAKKAATVDASDKTTFSWFANLPRRPVAYAGLVIVSGWMLAGIANRGKPTA